jgi:thiamine-phosphate pyrophosphorylase
MDQRLVTWACRRKRRNGPPPLWLFSDAARMPDLLRVVRNLPKGLCGVVFRHDMAADRAALGVALARLCRARRTALVVAGDARLAAALSAGQHWRGGRRFLIKPQPGRFNTASAHNPREVVRARRGGADVVFCSPVLSTASHPGARVLGSLGFCRLAAFSGGAKAYALGGIDGGSIKVLGKNCAGAGAIDAFLSRE